MSRELEWFDVGDVRLPVLRFGATDGQPLLLLPGLTDGLAPITDEHARAQLSDPPTDLLGRYRFHVVSHRFPTTSPLTTRDLATDAAGLLDVLRLDRPVVLVGHSMGAMVAQHLAVDRPELVDRMILSCTVGRADDGFREVLAGWASLVREGRWQEFYVQAIDTSYTGTDRLRRLIVQRVLPVKAPAPELADRHLAFSDACAAHDALDRLGDVAARTLVIAGDRDEVTGPHHARRLADALPDATVEIWNGLGHGLPEQARRRFGDRLRRFLEDDR